MFKILRKIFSMRDNGGNFGIVTALLVPLLITAAGGAVDISGAYTERANVQELLDAGVLSGIRKTDPASQRAEVESFLALQIQRDEHLTKADISANLDLKTNADGSLSGRYTGQYNTSFLGIIGIGKFELSVSSTAAMAQTVTDTAAQPCIWVLGNKSQAMLVNSGANVVSKKCEVDVASTSSTAFVMNSGSTIDTAKFCLKGTQYLNNGGKVTNFQTGCPTDPDPYAGKLSEPSVPATCTTSGAQDGASYTLEPGVHCDVVFNNANLRLTFAPGLHIIKGTMVVKTNAVVIADGVTFYFPDTNSKIQFNGGLTFTASAPTSGPNKGILMFEKTSESANNANKQPFVFNGSKGEALEGIIHLPNRDVTYNSTTNSTSHISLVVNTLIVNSANWNIEPYLDAAGVGVVGSATGPRLTK
jgi:Flp pilus assembly protein TadG